jgi:hypothetical protein
MMKPIKLLADYSYSPLTQLTWNLTRVGSANVKLHSALTQLMGSLTPHRLSVQKMKKGNVSIQNHLLTLLKGQHFENLTQMCSFDEKKKQRL